jgi:hypothetical protein
VSPPPGEATVKSALSAELSSEQPGIAVPFNLSGTWSLPDRFVVTKFRERQGPDIGSITGNGTTNGTGAF